MPYCVCVAGRNALCAIKRRLLRMLMIGDRVLLMHRTGSSVCLDCLKVCRFPFHFLSYLQHSKSKYTYEVTQPKEPSESAKFRQLGCGDGRNKRRRLESTTASSSTATSSESTPSTPFPLPRPTLNKFSSTFFDENFELFDSEDEAALQRKNEVPEREKEDLQRALDLSMEVEDKWSERFKRLNEVASARGLKPTRRPVDGNCFIDCIRERLPELSLLEIREKLAAVMQRAITPSSFMPSCMMIMIVFIDCDPVPTD